jgi:hypothetical protein
MPDAGASRKRQIQVTPGPFNDATASGAGRVPIAQVYEASLKDFAISGATETAPGVEPRFNKATLGRFPPSLAP